MLKTLAIQNVALIDRTEICFSDGLNVLSGETGAGKSVILDCIDFVLGAKADKSMIRFGTSECSVQAEFYVQDNDAVFSALDNLGIEPENTVIVSRKFTEDGKGSIRVNGVPVSAAMLRTITSLLVDVHGQSEHFFLLKENNQLSLLDKICGAPAEEKKQTLISLLAKRKEILKGIEFCGGDEGERSRRMDILGFQIAEIQNAALKAGEDEELAQKRVLFQNAERILEGLSEAKSALLSDESGFGGLDAVNAAKRATSSVARFNAEYAALSERLEAVAAEIADISDTLDSRIEDFDFDERERERVENRLDEIALLKKKYGGTVEEIEAFCARAQEEYQLLETSGERREQLQIELEHCEDEIYKTCTDLTAIRKRTAQEFTGRVVEELKTLNISSARFEVEFEGYNRPDAEKATVTGLDKIRFTFSANAGEPLKDLSKIISGGEMSRFMIAVKTQLNPFGIGTYLFDEIDAGIGGKTAWVVAEKFAEISKNTQIIAVSHLAQIAAFSDSQFLIEKTEAGKRTYTEIKEVIGEGRRKEIARLLSGDDGELSLKQADELLQKANAYKRKIH